MKRFLAAMVIGWALTGPVWAGGPKGPTVGQALLDLTKSSATVSVALVCTTNANLGVQTSSGMAPTPPPPGFNLEKWKQSVCHDSLGNMEQWLLSQYSGRKNFILIDRDATQQVLTDLHASTATVVMPDVRAALAQKLGATHVFVIRETIEETDGALYRKITETRDSRLLDADTGAVVAAESEKYVTRRPY